MQLNIRPARLLGEDTGIAIVNLHCMYHAECTQEGSNRVDPPAAPQEVEETTSAEASFLVHVLNSKLSLEPAQIVVLHTSAILIRVVIPIGTAPTNKLCAG